MEFDEGKWFDFSDDGKISFLIRPMDPGNIRDLAEKRKRGELDDEGMKKELFCSVFLSSIGIENIGAFSQEEQLQALFNDVEVRDFVLQKATGLLEERILKIEKVQTFLEQMLLKLGKLKS